MADNFHGRRYASNGKLISNDSSFHDFWGARQRQGEGGGGGYSGYLDDQVVNEENHCWNSIIKKVSRKEEEEERKNEFNCRGYFYRILIKIGI